MMKRILIALALLLFSIGSNAQFTNGTVLTAQALNAALAAPTITGGSINGSPVGQLTPAAGKFTNLIVTGSFSPGAGTVSLNSLATQAANTVVANTTASSASPTAVSIPGCNASNSAIQYTNGTGFVCGTTFALTTGNLSQFASTTSAQLAGVISDGTGSGSLVFNTNPALSGATITGGTVDNTPIGATTSSTGKFTNLTYTGTFTPASGTISLTGLASQATNTIVANATAGSASPTAISAPSCSTTASALNWTTNTGLTCNTTINAAQLGGATFASPGPIGSTTASTGAFITLSASSTVSGTGFTNLFASPPSIGNTVANTGAFTTLSSTGNFTPSQTNGIVGTTTNNNANAGSVGEYLINTTTGTSLSTTVTNNCTSVSLTAGDWDVQSVVRFHENSTTTLSFVQVGVSTTSATFGALGSFQAFTETFSAGVADQYIVSPVVRISIASTTTTFAVANAAFATSTLTCDGFIRARRVR